MISDERLLSHRKPGASVPDVITHASIYAYTTDPQRKPGHPGSGAPWLAALHVCCHTSLLGELSTPLVTSTPGDTWRHVPGFLWTGPQLLSPVILPANHGAHGCSWLQLNVSLPLCPVPKTAPLVPETILTTLSSPVQVRPCSCPLLQAWPAFQTTPPPSEVETQAVPWVLDPRLPCVSRDPRSLQHVRAWP